MTFTAATYNVLATAYLYKGDSSAVPPGLLDPGRRVPGLVRHVACLDADLFCLQEVEADAFDALRAGLGPLGHAGRIEFKGRGKPDGCTVFFRTGVFALRKVTRLEYRDEEKGVGQHSGFVAMILALEHECRLLGVANTHIRWDPPGTPRDGQVGHRQAAELIEACRRFDPPCEGWLICGDFNRGTASEVVAAFREAGFAFAHHGRPHVRSAVIEREASLIDYLFHTRELVASPIDPPLVGNGVVLPSEEQPSDHLALLAGFGWADAASASGG